jgi:quinol monooxygenase YgiN
MLVIAGSFEFDPDQRDVAVAAAIAMQQATVKEDGCLSYVMSADLERPDLIHIFEKWTSDDALQAHFRAPHMADFGAAARTAGIKATVTQYEIASEGPVRR